MPDYLPRVTRVLPVADFCIEAQFDDGKVIRFDMKPLLDEEEYAPLRDESFFVRACTVLNGMVVWDPTGQRIEENCIEVDPLMLYDNPAINEDFVYMGDRLI